MPPHRRPNFVWGYRGTQIGDFDCLYRGTQSHVFDECASIEAHKTVNLSMPPHSAKPLDFTAQIGMVVSGGIEAHR